LISKKRHEIFLMISAFLFTGACGLILTNCKVNDRLLNSAHSTSQSGNLESSSYSNVSLVANSANISSSSNKRNLNIETSSTYFDGPQIINNVSDELKARYTDILVTNEWYTGAGVDSPIIVLFGSLRNNSKQGVAEVISFDSDGNTVGQKIYLSPDRNGSIRVIELGSKDTIMTVADDVNSSIDFSIMFGFDVPD
jgi:hypothetical protein